MMEKIVPHSEFVLLLLCAICMQSMAADINFSVSPSSQEALNPTDKAGVIARPATTEKKSVSGGASGGKFGSASGILSGGNFPTTSISGEYTLEANATSFSFSSGGIFLPDGSGSGSPPSWSFTYKRDLFYLTSDKSKTIWIGDTTAFSTNLDADWYVLNEKKHTGKVFKVGEHWTPASPGSYTIIAKETISNTTEQANLTVAKISSLTIDATTPSATKISYKLEPSSIICMGIFKVGNGTETSKNISGSFNFTFDQTKLFQNSTLHLELSNSELSAKSVDESVEVAYVDKTASNSLVAWIAIEGVGLRSFPWSGTDSYTRYTYSCPESGKLIRLTPKNSSSVASLSAYVSFVNTGLNDSDYLSAFSHQFSDESSLTYLDKYLAALSPDWRCRGKDITSDKTKNIGATIKIYLTASTPSGPAFTIQGGRSVSLTLN